MRCARRSAAERLRARSAAEMNVAAPTASPSIFAATRLDIRVAEQIDNGQHRAESLDEFRVDSNKVQRRGAEIEEIVLDPDAIAPKNIGHNIAKSALR